MFRTDPRSSVFTLIFLLTLSSYAPMASPTPGGLERTSDYADLTRTVSDVGIDLDDNGRFDYLQIGVQVVVHVAGQYLVNVHGLSPEEDGETWHPDIGVYNRKREYLTPGTHMVHVLLYGPKIHQSGLNPRKINRITLQWVDYTLFEPIMQLEGFIRDMPLSKPYNYTDFDAPSREGEATFTVYPNRSVAVSGALDHTHMIPSNPGPEVQGTADIARDGNLIRASADCTFIIPPDAASRLPFDLPINTTQISYQEEYSIPQFSSHLSVNTTLPPWLASQYPFNTTNLSMAGTYSEGLASVGMNLSTLLPQMITTMFPFNATDVTVTVQCTNQSLNGTITFHVVSGFPIFDFNMDFEGNRTHLSLTGGGLVIYGEYPTMGLTLDRATVEDLLIHFNSTIPGQGAGSLHEMTGEILECTHLNTTLTTYGDTVEGAWVEFDVEVHGDLIELITYMMSGSSPVYMPEEEREQIHDLLYQVLNSTLNSLESLEVQIAYTHSTGEALVKMTLVDDALQLVRELAEIAAQIPVPEQGNSGSVAVNTTASDSSVYEMGLRSMMYPIYSTFYGMMALNATLPYLSEAQTRLTYSDTTGELQWRIESRGEIFPEDYYSLTSPLPQELPPEQRELLESLQEIRLCNVTSYNQSFTYQESVGELGIDCRMEGDLNAETNLVKSLLISFMNQTSPGQMTWREMFLNQTLIDVVGLELSFSVSKSSMNMNLTGLMLAPPTDECAPDNATCFALERLFSLAGDSGAYEPSRKEERLRVTVVGGSNITHSVTLFRPETVPVPDEAPPDMRRMVWANQSLSHLQDMEFRIVTEAYNATMMVTDQMNDPIPNATVNLYYPNGSLCTSLLTDDYGCTEATHIDYGYMDFGPYNLTANYKQASAARSLTLDHTGTYTISVATWSPQIVETVSAPQPVDATEKTAALLNITEISRPVKIAIRNVTAPSDVEPPPGTLKVLGNYVRIIANETELTINASLQIHYTQKQLDEAGLKEDTLRIHYWNGTHWLEISSRINPEKNHVQATISHFSLWTLMGQATAPIWTQPILWITIITIAALIAIIGYAIKLGKPSPPSKENRET